MVKPLAVHAFATYPNFFWLDPAAQRLRRVTTDLTQVTCKQCKMRILNELVQSDWSQLTSETLDVIRMWANHVKEK